MFALQPTLHCTPKYNHYRRGSSFAAEAVAEAVAALWSVGPTAATCANDFRGQAEISHTHFVTTDQVKHIERAHCLR